MEKQTKSVFQGQFNITSVIHFFRCSKKCSYSTSGHGSAGMVVMGWLLDFMILEVFSSLNDSMILPLGKATTKKTFHHSYHAYLASSAVQAKPHEFKQQHFRNV